MKKKSVSGPSITEIMSTFSKSIISGTSSMIKLTGTAPPKINYEVVVDKIDATIWNFPPAHFNNELDLKKYLILDGWLNSEKTELSSNTVVRKCRVEIYSDGTILLQKKRK